MTPPAPRESTGSERIIEVKCTLRRPEMQGLGDVFYKFVGYDGFRSTTKLRIRGSHHLSTIYLT